jgi:hypothetical protein
MRARAILLVLLAGCFSTARVPPEQVPRVNGAYVETTSIMMPQYNAVTGNMSIGSMSAIKSESKIVFDRVGGGTVTMRGELDVDLTTAGGRRYTFEHPVRATLADGVLDLRSSSRSGRVRLDDVSAAEIRQFDKMKSILAGSALGGAVALGCLALLLSI